MKYRVECEDRNTGKTYFVDLDARSEDAAANLAMLSGHMPTRAMEPPAPVVVARPPNPTPAPSRSRTDDRRAMVGLVIASLAALASCVPVLGLVLGVTGLTLALVSTPPGAIRTSAIIMATAALVLSLGWMVAWSILFVP